MRCKVSHIGATTLSLRLVGMCAHSHQQHLYSEPIETWARNWKGTGMEREGDRKVRLNRCQRSHTPNRTSKRLPSAL